VTAVVVDHSAGLEIMLRMPAGRRLGWQLAGQTVYVPESFYSEAAWALRRTLARGDLDAEWASETKRRA